MKLVVYQSNVVTLHFVSGPANQTNNTQHPVEDTQNKKNMAAREVYYERRKQKDDNDERENKEKELIPGNVDGYGLNVFISWNLKLLFIFKLVISNFIFPFISFEYYFQ